MGIPKFRSLLPRYKYTYELILIHRLQNFFMNVRQNFKRPRFEKTYLIHDHDFTNGNLKMCTFKQIVIIKVNE